VRLFETLKLQTCQSFEVIVVDQNPPGYLAEVLTPFRAFFPVQHLRSELGLSRARNVALGLIRGEFVAFPDDDCWYPEDLLESVANALTRHRDWDGLTGMLADPEEGDGFRMFHRTRGKLSFGNLFSRATSVTIFLRRVVVERVGRFDENLGRGTWTGMTAAEESDYLIRALLLNFFIFYSPNLCVFHRAWRSGDETQIGRAFGDRKALGYILRKYRLPLRLVLHKLIRSIGGIVLFSVRGNLRKTRYHWHAAHGILSGWLSFRQSRTSTRQEAQTRLSREIQYRCHPDTDIEA
jgi:glycosyltransferase involved in cell wall biosynthesis